jgi:hypothetical protein
MDADIHFPETSVPMIFAITTVSILSAVTVASAVAVLRTVAVDGYRRVPRRDF